MASQLWNRRENTGFYHSKDLRWPSRRRSLVAGWRGCLFKFSKLTTTTQRPVLKFVSFC